MTVRRRDFLRNAAAGGAILTMPLFLQGCGVAPATRLADPLPEDPFLGWFAIDRSVIARTMAALTANGADSAELYFQHRRQSYLGIDNGVPGRARTDIIQGAGLRVVHGDSTGFAFTEDLSAAGLLEAAMSAAAAARGGIVPPPAVLVAKPEGTLYATEVDWATVGAERKMPLLERVDRLARSLDNDIDNVAVSWSDTDERVLIATHDGHLIADHRPMTRLSAQVTATRGDDSHSGFANIAARGDISWYTDERIDAMTRDAVERTLILFDARRPPSGEMPVILSAGTSGVLLHEAIGHAMEADFNRDGTSAYASSLNQRIADPAVTIVDQGTLPNERGALNYDDEGAECGRTVLVENGILRSWLHDGVSARQYGVAPTGSGRRQSFRHQPMPRMTCTFMEDGSYAREELIGAVDRGIVAETYTDGSVQLGAGDFTFYVKNAWLVEKGRIVMPLRDLNLVGNGPETLRNITMVANDGRLDDGGWTCGKNGQTVPVSQGMPSVLVSAMTVEAV